MKRLYLFTSAYPYAFRESFLELEIEYLSRVFDEVHVVPYTYDEKVRPLPAKCILESSERHYSKKWRMVFNERTFIPFMMEFFAKKIYKSRVKFKQWITAYGSVNNMLNAKRYKSIFTGLTKDDVLYFYWGKSVVNIFIKTEAKIVIRFHGQWDLWEEEYEGYAPFRNEIMSRLDAAVAISTIGRDYIKRKYPQAKVQLFPLGTKDLGECIDQSKTDVIRVYSCSYVYPLKRVDLIFRSLCAITNHKVSWTHIGNGADFEKLQNMISSIPHPNLEVNLKGRLPHDETMEYVRTHKFDVFINLSTLEGVPVSIMEAISFDIPIVATNVGGTPDVVQKQCGILVSPNPSEKEVAEAIEMVYNGHFAPRDFWKTHYSADVNYGGYAKFLSQL